MTSDAVARLDVALDQMATVIGCVEPDQAELETPCLSWNIQALVDHVLDELEQFLVVVRGGEPDWSSPAPRVDPAQWSEAFRKGAHLLQVHWRADTQLDSTTELVTVWRDAGYLRDNTAELPRSGQVPRTHLVDQQVVEFTMHGWDLAQAIDFREELNSELARDCLIWLTGALAPQLRGSESDGCAFGPEQPVVVGNSRYDQLAAFCGRKRDWVATPGS